jgi:hypothetical protein
VQMKRVSTQLLLFGGMVALLAGCTSSSTPATTSTSISISISTSTSTSTSSGVIAWVAVPAPPMTTTTTTTTTLPAATPCTASQLRVGLGPTGAATGNIDTPLVLTNTGTSTCRLTGYPTLVGVTASGKEAAIDVRHGTFFGNLVPADLAPGRSGSLLIGGDDQCLAQPSSTASYRRLVVELPGNDGSLSVENRLPCIPVDESQLGVEPPLPGVPLPGTLAFLNAEVQMSNQIQADHLLRYVVVLTNPGSKPVSLVPCPGYTELLVLKVAGRYREERWSYELNCRPVPRLLGGQSARFAMQIPVPAGLQPGVVKFGWSLNSGNGPYAGRGLVVTG